MFMCTDSAILVGSVWFFLQAEDGIRDLVRSRGLGDVYKRQLSDIGEWSTEIDRWAGSSLAERTAKKHQALETYSLSLIHI